MALAVLETAAARYTRDVVSQSTDRKNRNYDSQPHSRLLRNYVDDGTSAFEASGLGIDDIA